MKKITATTVWLLMSLASINTAHAHHGWSFYGGEPLEIKGVIVEKQFRNPHDFVKVMADGQLWLVYFGPPSRNQRAGLTNESVNVGDQVVVYGHQHNDSKRLEMKTERIQIGDKRYNMYPERE